MNKDTWRFLWTLHMDYTPGLGCDRLCVHVMTFPDVVWFPPAWVLIRDSSAGELQRDTQHLWCYHYTLTLFASSLIFILHWSYIFTATLECNSTCQSFHMQHPKLYPRRAQTVSLRSRLETDWWADFHRYRHTAFPHNTRTKKLEQWEWSFIARWSLWLAVWSLQCWWNCRSRP